MFVLMLFLAVLYCASLESAQAALSDKLIRLHVIAASDSEADQELKLKIRDRVLNEISPLLSGCETREEAERILSNRLIDISKTAEKCAEENGSAITVQSSLTREMFGERQYESFSLPAGEYSSLRIVINEGEGKNWWCVVFPPLCCEAAVRSDVGLSDAFAGLSGEETELITGSDSEYIIKFRVLDFLAWLKQKADF